MHGLQPLKRTKTSVKTHYIGREKETSNCRPLKPLHMWKLVWIRNTQTKLHRKHTLLHTVIDRSYGTSKYIQIYYCSVCSFSPTWAVNKYYFSYDIWLPRPAGAIGLFLLFVPLSEKKMSACPTKSAPLSDKKCPPVR